MLRIRPTAAPPRGTGRPGLYPNTLYAKAFLAPVSAKLSPYVRRAVVTHCQSGRGAATVAKAPRAGFFIPEAFSYIYGGDPGTGL